jgi:hypothetical protein
MTKLKNRFGVEQEINCPMGKRDQFWIDQQLGDWFQTEWQQNWKADSVQNEKEIAEFENFINFKFINIMLINF